MKLCGFGGKFNELQPDMWYTVGDAQEDVGDAPAVTAEIDFGSWVGKPGSECVAFSTWAINLIVPRINLIIVYD